MAASKSGNGRRTTAKAKLEALQQENDKLRSTIESLKQVNASQLQRLVNAELLKARIKELEQQLARKADE